MSLEPRPAADRQTDGSAGTGQDTRPQFSQRSIFSPASVFHSEPSVVGVFTRRIFMSARE